MFQNVEPYSVERKVPRSYSDADDGASSLTELGIDEFEIKKTLLMPSFSQTAPNHLQCCPEKFPSMKKVVERTILTLATRA